MHFFGKNKYLVSTGKPNTPNYPVSTGEPANPCPIPTGEPNTPNYPVSTGEPANPCPVPTGKSGKLKTLHFIMRNNEWLTTDGKPITKYINGMYKLVSVETKKQKWVEFSACNRSGCHMKKNVGVVRDCNLIVVTFFS